MVAVGRWTENFARRFGRRDPARRPGAGGIRRTGPARAGSASGALHRVGCSTATRSTGRRCSTGGRCWRAMRATRLSRATAARRLPHRRRPHSSIAPRRSIRCSPARRSRSRRSGSGRFRATASRSAARRPGIGGLHVVVTHSGVTLAPLLGRLVAEEIVEGRGRRSPRRRSAPTASSPGSPDGTLPSAERLGGEAEHAHRGVGGRRPARAASRGHRRRAATPPPRTSVPSRERRAGCPPAGSRPSRLPVATSAPTPSLRRPPRSGRSAGRARMRGRARSRRPRRRARPGGRSRAVRTGR